MPPPGLQDLLAVTRAAPEIPPEGQVPSAVLIALITMDDGQTGVILTERSGHLRHHAGQISFPGGRIDNGETPVETALREAEEEIALARDQVTVLGHLPGVLTTAGFHIAPVLGRVDGNFTPVAAPAEVARVLIEPIVPLLDRRHHQSVMREAGGRRYQSWDIAHERENIWGATARILVQWGQLISPELQQQEAGQ
ncbi:MAG: NUDIX hydrolase [Candidatus Puniceispirillales bacterium]